MPGEINAPLSTALHRVIRGVQVTGDPAVLFPSSYLGDLEAVVAEIHRCDLRMAGIPSGGITILPMIPLADDELFDVCQEYTRASDDAERAELRRRLYLRPYTQFFSHSMNSEALYHPADYVARIAELCRKVQLTAEDDIPALLESTPYLHVSPIKDICAQLRQWKQVPDSDDLNGFANGSTAFRERVRDAVDELSLPFRPGEDEMSVIETDANLDGVFQKDAMEEPETVTEDLTGNETVDQTNTSTAEYLHESDFELITKSAYFFEGEGANRQLIAVYVTNAIPVELCRAAAAVLEPAATRKNLRAATNGGEPPETGIVGFYDYLNNPTQRKCRETEFMRKNCGAIESQCAGFLQAVDKAYEQYAPAHYSLQRVAIPAHFQLCSTVFSTVTVNQNFRTAVHRDSGDFRSGLAALCVVNGDFEGCHLAIKKIKKAFRLGVGDLLLFDASLEHGNTELLNPHKEWKRTSVVCYLRNGLLSSTCEMERRRHLNRLVVEQLEQSHTREATININRVDPSLPPLYLPFRLAGKLAPVQLSALGFIAERTHKKSGCVVAMTMGLGKTLVALALCFSYLHMYPDRDILVLAPKPIIGHWQEECAKWRNYGLCFRRFVTSDGLSPLRFEEDLLRYDQQMSGMAPKVGHVLVLNPEYINSFLRRFKRFDPILIIVDEGHRVATKGNKLIESLGKLKCTLRVVLSGTPLQNDASELYRLVAWVNKSVPSAIPQRRFLECATVINRYVDGDDASFPDAVFAQQFLQDWMKGFVFREMESDLPPLHDYLLVCGSSATQKRLRRRLGEKPGFFLTASEHRPAHLSTHPLCYFAFEAGAYQSIAGGHKRKADRGEETLAATRQTLAVEDLAELDGYYDLIQNDNVEAFVNLSGKLRALVSVVLAIQQKNEKAIIFSQYCGSQDLIHRVLTALQICAFTVRGRDSQERRRYAIEQFRKDANLKVLVLSTKIAAFGLDFTVANHVLLFDSWWNPQVDTQAIARAYRRNQQRPVTVYRLASEEEDASVVRTQIRKVALFNCIIHEKTSRCATAEELHDYSEVEDNPERRLLWQSLKANALEGGSPALLNVFLFRDTVKESEKK